LLNTTTQGSCADRNSVSLRSRVFMCRPDTS
jgi:hypothetical protein